MADYRAMDHSFDIVNARIVLPDEVVAGAIEVYVTLTDKREF